MDRAEEQELIRQAIDGQRRALDTLVAAHYAMMFRVAYRWCGNKADAEDVTHNAFVKFAESLPRFRGDSSLRTWLYRITLNTARDWQRQKKRRPTAALHDDIRAHGPGADDTAYAHEIMRHVGALPEGERAALLLVAGENLSHAEAAKILGCMESTVSWRIHSARRKLQHLIDKADRHD